MIVDVLKNKDIYCGISAGIMKAFKFIEDFNKSELPVGRYDLDGDNVYAMVQNYDTLPQTEKKWETHKEYIDVQYVAEGNEKIYWVNVEGLIPCTEYNIEKDYMLFDGFEGNGVILEKGAFMILFPEDAHKPGCTNAKTMNINKIVVKVKYSKS